MISVVIISKDEEGLDNTLSGVSSQVSALSESGEVVVVDASAGRLDHIRQRHEATVRWLDFSPLPGVSVSIPHQRNAGVRAARGDIIVFTDAGCVPEVDWLENLVAPLRGEETATTGTSQDSSGARVFPSEHIRRVRRAGDSEYLAESPTLNFAFSREIFDKLNGFDETFEYGSDVDFTWRLNDSGRQVLYVPGAVIRHDYGTSSRQHRRSFVYGKARARLYRKHRARRRNLLRDDPMVIAYPLFLLGLPITFIFPAYPLLLLIPAWRNRSEGMVKVLTDHLWYGAGVLAVLAGK